MVEHLESISFKEEPSNIRKKIIVLRGATGEGKRTAILQTVCELAKKNTWQILYTRTPDAQESDDYWSELIKNLPLSQFKPWLIVLLQPEAPTINKIFVAIENNKDRKDIKFLMCCLNLDWQQVKQERLKQSSQSKKPSLPYRHYIYQDEILNDLSQEDAENIVAAWDLPNDKKGGLRNLAEVPDEDRVDKLMTAAKCQTTSYYEGTFFGAMLDVRWGAEGLKRHIENDLLERLEKERISLIDGEDITLKDAFAYISVMHAICTLGESEKPIKPMLNREILANVLNVEEKDFENEVIECLKLEAIAIRTRGKYICTRHYKIAVATQAILSKKCNYCDQLYSNLFKAAMSIYSEDNDFHKFCEWGNCPKDIFRDGENENSGYKKYLGIMLAEEVFDRRPDDQHLLTNLSLVYRKDAGSQSPKEKPMDSLNLFTLKNLDGLKDKDREFYNEWSAAAGECDKRGLSILLSAISLSDNISGNIDSRRVSAGFLALSYSFLELYDKRKSPVFLQCCWAISELALHSKNLVDNETYTGCEKNQIKAQTKAKQPRKNFIKKIADDGKNENDFIQRSRLFEFIFEQKGLLVIWETVSSKSLPSGIPHFDDLKFQELKAYLRIDSKQK